MPSLYIPIDNLIPNRYRDPEAFPPQEPKLAALRGSEEKSGFWDNILTNLDFNQHDNKPVKGYKDENDFINQVSMLSMKDQVKITSKLTFELAYGLHRLIILQEKKDKYKVVCLPTRKLSSDDLLHIMADENHEDFGQSIQVMIETVQQIKDSLTAQVAECKTFKDYQKKGYGALTAGNFKAIKDGKGVGIGTIEKFLGGTWKNTGIRAANSAIRHMDEGVIDKSYYNEFPSTDSIRRTAELLDAIVAEDIDAWFKNRLVYDCRQAILDAKPTGNTIGNAAAQLKDGNDPVAYLRNQLKIVAYDPVLIVKKLIDPADENAVSMEAVIDAGCPKDIAEKAQAAIDEDAKKQARADELQRRIEELMESDAFAERDDGDEALAKQWVAHAESIMEEKNVDYPTALAETIANPPKPILPSTPLAGEEDDTDVDTSDEPGAETTTDVGIDMLYADVVSLQGRLSAISPESIDPEKDAPFLGALEALAETVNTILS